MIKSETIHPEGKTDHMETEPSKNKSRSIDTNVDREADGKQESSILVDESIISRLKAEVDDLGVVFVKIAEFSKYCSTHEHVGGSDILEGVSNQFKRLLPDGVDEFILPRLGLVYVLKDDVARKALEDFVQRLSNRAKSPFAVKDQSYNLSIGIGIARSWCEGDGDLIDRAQFAEFKSSEENGNTYHFYKTDEAETIRDEVNLKNDLYTALDEDQFFLKYQPVVSLDDYTVKGGEALVRWDHPERGEISPGKFIPLAERTGQILFLDRWVIKRALKQVVRWEEALDEDCAIGINISAWQFRDDYLIEKMSESLEEMDLPPSLIKVEVTETSMMKDVDRTARVLHGLDDLGVRIALDDFGTGHSSFEYLSQFPIDELKIDRSFLDFDDVYSKNRGLVDMMIQTGKRVGTSILAEGVETTEQLNFLRNRGCEKAQGFLFSRPISTAEFSSLVEANEPIYQKDDQ